MLEIKSLLNINKKVLAKIDNIEESLRNISLLQITELRHITTQVINTKE